MSIKRVSIHNLRNLIASDIKPSQDVNLFFGENGSGKTSFLEAINILTLGRSFRSHKIKSLINEHSSELTVFGHLQSDDNTEVPIGVTRQRSGQSAFKVGGEAINSTAELAHQLPLLVINADTFSLLEGSPKNRRQFLDWLVFHVEPEFFPAWKAAQRCLKHRNSLLRRGRITPEELAPWDKELAALTEKIHTLRSRCFESFKVLLEGLLLDFVAIEGLSVSLYQGWEKEQPNYAAALSEAFDRDLKRGYTGSGAHRADLRIRVNGYNAAEILSRGQQKLLVSALKVAQGVVFEKLTKRKCIYLVDDLPSELDTKYRQLFVDWLSRLNTQVFITGVEQEDLVSPWRAHSNKQVKTFHVERGQIKEV